MSGARPSRFPLRMRGSFGRYSPAPIAVAVVLACIAASSGACSSSEGGGDTPDSTPAGDSSPTDGGADAGECIPSNAVATAGTTPPDDLAAWCVVSLKDGAVVPLSGSVIYDLNTPLFSDYSIKVRTVWVPPGQSAKWADQGAFDFPVGTVISKSFGFPDDARKPKPVMRWIETRILTRTKDGWIALPYVWDATQTKATLKIEGEVRPIDFIQTSGDTIKTSYLIPSSGQCKKCHEADAAMGLIGPKARNLNRTMKYDDGESSQLARWTKLGILSGAPADDKTWPKLPKWDDTAASSLERGRAWLDVNCAHCHSEGGSARTSGLILKYEETDARKTGVCKNPIAAGKATGGLDYDVVPGQPDKSILFFRINSVEPGILMPEVGRSVVHAEGAAVVRQWITGLTGTCPPVP